MDKTVVELFAGVGGFRCGFNHVSLKDGKVHEEDNWDFVWANQWEPATKTQDAYECYGKRFGYENLSNIDIFEVDKNSDKKSVTEEIIKIINDTEPGLDIKVNFYDTNKENKQEKKTAHQMKMRQ